jgi:tight adherence protein B
MSGTVSAALLLSTALIVAPGSPRRRIAPPGPVGCEVPLLRANAVGGIIACAAVVATLVLPTTTVLAVAVLGMTAGLRYRRRRSIGRAADEGRMLEAALDVLVGELRTGSHPVRAFRVAADETDGTVADSLRAVAARAKLGADVIAGLRSAARSSALPENWNRLAACWQLASDHGLAIATLMRAAQRDIAERQRFSARVTAGMAGARATAVILAGLPVLGMLLGQLVGASPLQFFLSGHVGGWLLVIGSMLACAGLVWSDQITDRLGS